MREIGVVLTYLDRQKQLQKTLASIKKTAHQKYNVVIVDDASVEPPRTDFDILTVKKDKKNWVNPVVAINMGIHYLLKNYDPKIIIIQNAECYHVGDVLAYAERHVSDKNYISFGCFSVEEKGDYDLQAVMEANEKGAILNGGSAWYNHPVHRPVGYDFCAAASKGVMLKLNGHDERYKDDLGSADRDLVRRVRRLGIPLVITEYPFVVHQWHPRGNRRKPVQERNRAIFNATKNGGYRAKHIITEDFLE